MNITEQQLAYAAKALGIDAESLEDKWSNGEKFAEWAVPVLEERHDVILRIYWAYYVNPKAPWTVDDVHTGLWSVGPDIDTAVLMLAVKIWDEME